MIASFLMEVIFMQYVLSNEFTAIAESTGTIANISTVPAEISTSPSRGSGLILYRCLQKRT